jgi:hypothetical protein
VIRRGALGYLRGCIHLLPVVGADECFGRERGFELAIA